MENLKKIIETKLGKINIELDRVSAKKLTRDIVKRNLDELQEEVKTELVKMIEEFEAEKKEAMDKIECDALNLKNRIVISSLENTVKEFKLMLLK